MKKVDVGDGAEKHALTLSMVQRFVDAHPRAAVVIAIIMLGGFYFGGRADSPPAQPLVVDVCCPCEAQPERSEGEEPAQ